MENSGFKNETKNMNINVNDIIEQEGLYLRDDFIKAQREDFYKFADVRKLIGSYCLLFFIISFVIVNVYIIIVASAVVPLTPAYWIVYLILLVAGVGIISLIGYQIKRKSKKMQLQELVNFQMVKLIQWTSLKLKNNPNTNEKRIYIENLINCYFDYYTNQQIEPWNVNPKIKSLLKKFYRREDVKDSLLLTLQLYDRLFLKNKYDPKGALIITKIILPMIYLCDDQNILNHVKDITKKFSEDTDINIFQVNLIDIKDHQLQQEIILTKDFFHYKKRIFHLFCQLWELKYEHMQKREESVLFQICFNCKSNRCICQKTDQQNSFTQLNQQKIEKQFKINERSSVKNRLVYSKFSQPQEIDIVHSPKEQETLPQSFRESKEELENQDNYLLESNSFLYKNKSDTEHHYNSYAEELVKLAQEGDEYKRLITEKDYFVDKKQSDVNTILLFRLTLDLHYPLEYIFKLLTDTEEKMKYDKYLKEQKTMKIIDDKTNLVYSHVKMPLMVADREFLQERTILENFQGFDRILMFRSIEDDSIPPKKGLIRAYNKLGGNLLKKINDRTTQIVTISQTDLRGNLPAGLVNKVIGKGFANWIGNINKGLEQYQKRVEGRQLIQIKLFEVLICFFVRRDNQYSYKVQKVIRIFKQNLQILSIWFERFRKIQLDFYTRIQYSHQVTGIPYLFLNIRILKLH